MTYVISNIHGNYDKFCEMLQKISFKDSDVMYILGDMVDYGDKSMELIGDVSMRYNVLPILGEHDMRAYKLLSARLDDVRPDAARGLCDTVKAKYSDAVVVFALVSDGKLNFVAAAGADAVKAGAHAGNILRDISAICGGKGGGRPDSAMSGGKDLDKIPEALAKVEELLK